MTHNPDGSFTCDISGATLPKRESKVKEIEVGDRVRVSGYSQAGADLDGRICTITQRKRDGNFAVDNDWSVKPSQCRKVKPKKPLREVWVNYYGACSISAHFSEEGAQYSAAYHAGEVVVCETVHFREVREKGKK